MFEDLRTCVRDGDCLETVTAALERLVYDSDTEEFAAYMLDQYLPHLHQRRVALAPPRDNAYNTTLYLDILHLLFSFLFVEEQFTPDYDE